MDILTRVQKQMEANKTIWQQRQQNPWAANESTKSQQAKPPKPDLLTQLHQPNGIFQNIRRHSRLAREYWSAPKEPDAEEAADVELESFSSQIFAIECLECDITTLAIPCDDTALEEAKQ